MSIEKPISTIRKAVKRLAEDRAKKESIDNPEPRHYEDVFLTYKAWRLLDPERLELTLKVTAKSQDLKNEIGPELFNVFDEAWIDATKDGKIEMDKAIGQLNRTINLSHNELKKEIEQVPVRFLNEKIKQVKNNPKIISAFSGKEELLNKCINTITSSMMELIRYNRENPSVF